VKALYLILTVAALSGAAALGADSGFTVAQRTLVWSKPVRVTNDLGKVRLLQTAPATDVFWTLWRTNKTAMRAAGFSARPTTNGWEALYWKEIK
jgi:hypothetical protein